MPPMHYAPRCLAFTAGVSGWGAIDVGVYSLERDRVNWRGGTTFDCDLRKLWELFFCFGEESLLRVDSNHGLSPLPVCKLTLLERRTQ